MQYAYLFIPAIVCFLLPVLASLYEKHEESVAQKRMIAEKKARDEARREEMLKRNAEKQVAAKAEQAEKPEVAKRKPGRPRKNPPLEQRAEIIPPAEATVERAEAPTQIVGNNAFAGQVVAFTGTLPGMTRREAIEAVKINGGKAFETMPASTTLLVVGDNPGTGKQDKADNWSCRRITAEQFFAMLKQPLTFEPDTFEAFFRTWLENHDTHEEA